MPPAARLLAEIERSGSGSVSFWTLYWELLDQLTGDELRRVLTAAGRRTLFTRLGIRFPSAGIRHMEFGESVTQAAQGRVDGPPSTT